MHELQGDKGDSEVVSRFLNTCACASLGGKFHNFHCILKVDHEPDTVKNNPPPTPTSEAPGGEPRDLSQNLFNSEQGFLVVLSLNQELYLPSQAISEEINQ